MSTRFVKTFLAFAALTACTAQLHAVSPLTATPATVSLTYQKPSTAGAGVVVSVKATASTFFTVDPASVPIWLTLSASNGTAVSGGVNLTFTPNSVGGSLAAGTFSATVKLQVVGQADLSVPVTLVISNVAPTLSIKESLTQNINWTQGSAYPTIPLTVLSTNEPISFTVAVASTAPSSPAWVKTDHASGVAYSWGTALNVSFLQQVFVTADVADVLTGTVTVTPSAGSAVVVNIAITVLPPSATITRLFPAETATQAGAVSGDTLTVVVTGTNFVDAPSNKKTVVTLNTTTLNTANVSVISPTTMVLTVPADTYIAAAGDVIVGVSNPTAGPEVTSTLKVTDNPIIYSITGSAAYIQATPGTNPNVAPYELVSIFGDNFGPTGSNMVSATVDSYGRYPNKLTAGGNDMTVTFYKADGTTLVADAYLIFATKTQINAMVPSGIVGNTTVKVVVTYNSLASTKFAATVVAADPGVFTTNSTGTGQGAILLAKDYSANSTSNKVAVGETILIYMTGLGVPNSTATNAAGTTAAVFPTSCVSTANYMGKVNTTPTIPSPLWTTIDGAIIVSTNLGANKLPPCMATTGAVTVSVGGKAATVSYAGFVADSVAGLYQINAVIPTGVTIGNAVPVVVTAGGIASQTGVTIATK